MRVFLDANVLFSASNPGSNISRLVDAVAERHTAVTSNLALSEAGRNVARKRPAWSTNLQQLETRLEIVESVRFPLSVKLDDKDVPILCTAIHADCHLLATGDRRHFGHLYEQTIEGVLVVSLAQLAELLFRNG